jgi:hypothetical protein
MTRLKTRDRIVTGFFALALLFVCPLRALAESTSNVQLSKQGQEAARLLGIEGQVQKFIDLKNAGKAETFDRGAAKLQLYIIRRVMTAGVQLRAVSAKLDREITFEQQAVDKLTRQRDFNVAVITNANFLQLGILSMIIDGPLEESHQSGRVLAGNELNVVSGGLVGALAILAFWELKGGTRHSQPEPNMLGQPLGLDPPADEKIPSLMWTYLNSVSPTSQHGLTRREQLIEYWKTAKVIPINISKQSTIEQVSAFGPSHRRRRETIRLINSRVIMLYDLRAMIDLLNSGLVDLLQALD